MQTMLRMVGYGDNVGSGFPTILDAWKKQNWRRPDLDEDTELNQVNLKLWMVSLMPEDCIEEIQLIFGEMYHQLNHDEQLILVTALLEDEISNSRLQEIIEVHKSDISLILAGMVRKGMLIQSGYGRGMIYKINRNFLVGTQDGTQDGTQENGQSTNTLSDIELQEIIRKLI